MTSVDLVAQATVKARVDLLESKLCDGAEEHAREVAALKDKVHHVEKAVTDLSAVQVQELHSLREDLTEQAALQARCSQDIDVLKAAQAHNSAVREKLCDAMEKHETDVEALKTSNARHPAA